MPKISKEIREALGEFVSDCDYDVLHLVMPVSLHMVSDRSMHEPIIDRIEKCARKLLDIKCSELNTNKVLPEQQGCVCEEIIHEPGMHDEYMESSGKYRDA
jgi:hypothetical protein